VNDWFHEAMNRVAATQWQKGADYQLDHDPFSNFRRTGEQFDLATYEAAEFNVVQKLERLKALRYNDRQPVNEAVEDTYKDLAVYGVLAYAMYLAEMDQKTPAKSTDTDGSEPGQHDNAAKIPDRILLGKVACPDCGHFESVHVIETKPHPQLRVAHKIVCHAGRCDDNCATWNARLVATSDAEKARHPQMMSGSPSRPGRGDLIVGAFDKEHK
jgi:hypothetical protein